MTMTRYDSLPGKRGCRKSNALVCPVYIFNTSPPCQLDSSAGLPDLEVVRDTRGDKNKT